jgi:CheY-like chemotaxis protein
MMIAEELREAGFRVIETASPHQALDVLTHAFDVSVMLSDVQMPGGMDGVALARLVRAAYPAIKIALTSGRGVTGEATEYDAFFPKPCDPLTMVGRIKALLD